VPTFADRGCHVVSMMDLYGHILGFLDRKYAYKSCLNYLRTVLHIARDDSGQNNTLFLLEKKLTAPV
jgi:hypothetical protein